MPRVGSWWKWKATRGRVARVAARETTALRRAPLAAEICEAVAFVGESQLFLEPVGHGRSQQGDAGDGGEAELEGEIAQDAGVQSGHYSSGEGQWREDVTGSSGGHSGQIDCAHDGSADHGRGHAAEDGVAPEGKEGDKQEIGAFSAQQKRGEGDGQDEDYADVEAGDCEQVGRAGVAEVFFQFRGEVVALSEKQGLGDGGLGFGVGVFEASG